MMQATYTKLRDSSWGVRITGYRAGMSSEVSVTKRDGSAKVERLGEVVWSEGDVALATIATSSASCKPAPAAPAARKPRAARKPSPEPVAGEFAVRKASSGRDDGYDVGACSFFSRVAGGTYGVVIEAGKSRNMDDDEWYCWARVRPASEAEIAPVRKRCEARAGRESDAKRLAELLESIVRTHPTQTPSTGGRLIVVRRQPMGAQETLRVEGETVSARHPGHYDDWQERCGQTSDAALAAEVIAIADRLDL